MKLEDLLKKHKNIFGENPKYEKINVGFTNTIYNINDSYIIKICTNFNNETNFKKEIEFYNSNKNNELIPKLYYSNTDKKEIPYFYEIIEKIKGVSLYNVWHTFNEEQRENIIKQLCDAMKQIHSNVEEQYDWAGKFKKEFETLFNNAKELNIFNEEEQKLLNYAYKKFEKYLVSNEFVLVHNDLHFDNIFYNNGKIKIIDFERSMYAPRDYELAIIYNMVRKPWKFASEETEQFTDSRHYSNIMLYIEKYYKKLIQVDNLYQRLAIYDMVYYMKHLIKNPEIEELKNDVLLAAQIVALKDELKYENIKTPQELMIFMNINIEYGWIDNKQNKHINSLDGFRENYKTMTIKEMIETGLGTCIDQAKMIKNTLERLGYETKIYCHRAYETEENFDKEVRMHCFVLFKYNNTWYHFEHSNRPKRGIHEYKSIEEALRKITDGFEEHGDIRKLTEINEIPEKLTFKEFNQYVNKYDKTKRR